MTNVRARILAICLGLVTACYSPPKPDCGFRCSVNGECPSDYFCASDQICHHIGTPESTVCAVDARPDTPHPIDAVPHDADTTPPQVFQTMPAQNVAGVATSTTIRVEFTEPVLNVNTSTFLVSANSVPISGTVTKIDFWNYEFTPTALLPANGTIAVTLTNGIYDQSGNPLGSYTYNFMTGP